MSAFLFQPINRLPSPEAVLFFAAPSPSLATPQTLFALPRSRNISVSEDGSVGRTTKYSTADLRLSDRAINRLLEWTLAEKETKSDVPCRHFV